LLKILEKISASARISKGKGQGAVLAKKGNLHRTRKNGQNSTPFRVNKMFSISFNTFKTL
jgi:hypothetical protein